MSHARRLSSEQLVRPSSTHHPLIGPREVEELTREHEIRLARLRKDIERERTERAYLSASEQRLVAERLKGLVREEESLAQTVAHLGSCNLEYVPATLSPNLGIADLQRQRLHRAPVSAAGTNTALCRRPLTERSAQS